MADDTGIVDKDVDLSNAWILSQPYVHKHQGTNIAAIANAAISSL
jgi:hypothetical protein